MPLKVTEAEVTELRSKGVDILPSMIEGDDRHRSASASNHPDDANITSLDAEVKQKAAAEAARAAELKTREAEDKAANDDRTLALDNKITAEELDRRNKARFDARVAREQAAKQAATTGTAAATTTAQTEKKEPPKKSGFQQRIDELTRKTGDAVRARQKAEAEAKEAQERATKAEAEAAAAKTKKMPERGDFDTEAAYIAALTQHSASTAAALTAAESAKREAEASKKTAEDTAKAAQDDAGKAVVEKWNATLDEARTRYADFDKVALRQDVQLATVVAQQVLTSDLGADILFYLGNNVEEVKRINALGDPLAVARELGGIERSLREGVEKKRAELAAAAGGGATTTTSTTTTGTAEASSTSGKTVSAAPAPVSSINGSGASGATFITAAEAAKLTMPEYVAARQAGRIR